MEMQKRKCFLLVTLLLAGLTMGFIVPSIAAPSGGVSIQHAPITIDGNPSDWTGIAGGDNTWRESHGEGIWTDVHNDDTGNGSYIYPNGTHEGILDSKGRYSPGATVEWQAWIYTGYPHGGCVDLVEFRVTSYIPVTGYQDGYLYLMFRLYNMGNREIATQWGTGYEHFGFGRMAIQVLIDQEAGGRTDLDNTLQANANVSSDYGWEVMIWLCGENDTASHGPNAAAFVELANGSRYYVFPDNTTLVGNADIYPGVIEAKVPLSVIGDNALQTWNFAVLVGGYDEGRYRSVEATGMPFFRFMGGEDDPGYDPNIIDLAFLNTTAEQEALLGSFTGSSWVELGSTAFHAVEFLSDGDVIPWIPLLTIPIALIALVIAKKKLKLLKTEHQ